MTTERGGTLTRTRATAALEDNEMTRHEPQQTTHREQTHREQREETDR